MNESPFDIWNFLLVVIYVVCGLGLKFLIFWSLS